MSKVQKCFTTSKRESISWQKLVVVVGFDDSSLINGLDEMPRCESSPLTLIHLIKDEALGFSLGMHEEEASCSTFIECSRWLHGSPGRVHQAP